MGGMKGKDRFFLDGRFHTALHFHSKPMCVKRTDGSPERNVAPDLPNSRLSISPSSRNVAVPGVNLPCPRIP